MGMPVLAIAAAIVFFSFGGPGVCAQDDYHQLLYEKIKKDLGRAERGDIIETFWGRLAEIRKREEDAVYILVYGSENEDKWQIDDLAGMIKRVVKKKDPEYKNLITKPRKLESKEGR